MHYGSISQRLTEAHFANVCVRLRPKHLTLTDPGLQVIGQAIFIFLYASYYCNWI